MWGANDLSFFTKKEQIVILLLVIVIICVIGYSVLTNESITILSKDEKGNIEIGVKTDGGDSQNSIEDEEVESKSEEVEERIIKVHICGKVHNPGVVELTEGSRLQDAIELAGGHIVGEADLERVNLARILIDGLQVKVPGIDEEIDDSEIYVLPNTSNNDLGISDNGKININTASKEILTRLPGIGEVLAERIIEYRRKNKFSSIDDITKVSGIGVVKYEGIKDLITIDWKEHNHVWKRKKTDWVNKKLWLSC